MWFWLWPWFWATAGYETTIREGAMDDARRLAEIHAQGFATGWSAGEFTRMIAEGCDVDLLITRGAFGEAVAGFAISRIVAGEAELLSIALEPLMRGRGRSGDLLRKHAANLRRGGAETLFLEVAADNTPALALYRGLGFVEIGRRRGYYPEASAAQGRRDALTMKWDLSGFDPTPRAYA